MGKLRIIAIPAVLALTLMGTSGPPRTPGAAMEGSATMQPVTRPPGDFNGDGFADLAVGVPFEDVSGVADAGAVNVVYGSDTGLVAAGNQFWTQDSPGIGDSAQPSDQFGFATAAGDFNDDGFADLAIGVPLENPPEDSGAVNVIYGSSAGLTSTGSQVWSQGSGGIVGSPEADDQFGRSLAVGDFNGDGFADLAIGGPYEDISGHRDAGGVNVIYGSAAGLSSGGNQVWMQNSGGIVGSSETGDMFGFGLAASDFDGDTREDLAIGVPGEDSPLDAGFVNVIYGSTNGLAAAGNQAWGQDRPGMAGSAEPNDLFGYSLAGGDFDDDGFADLAVGVPFEDIGAKANAGAVSVIYGSAGRLRSGRNQLWTQGSPGIAGSPEPRDEFGFALADGDFDADMAADLAIGVPGENYPTNAGAVNVIYGSTAGLAAAGNQRWTQDGLSGSTSEVADQFGFSMAAGSYGKDPAADLAIGVPSEDVITSVDAGAMNVVYGSPQGLQQAGNQYWTQGDLTGSSERGDRFGYGVENPGGEGG